MSPEHQRSALRGFRTMVAAKPGYAKPANASASGSRKSSAWMKTVGGMRKLHHRGTALVGWLFTFSARLIIWSLSRLIPVAA